MARKSKKQHSKKQAYAVAKEEEDKVTWEDIAAMSDSEDDDDAAAIDLNTKAKNLRQAIADGKFDAVIASMKKNKQGEDEDEEEFEEDDLDASSSESVNDEDDDDSEKEEAHHKEEGEDEESEDSEEDESDSEEDEKMKDGTTAVAEESKGNDRDDDEEEKSESEEQNEGNSDEDSDRDGERAEKYKQLQENNQTNSKALAVVTAELAATHSKLPWAEKFVIVPPTPLPFGENGDPEKNPLDIHDDLKREVAFYNTAVEAVNEARTKCKEAGIPFSRPEDFFAEMVKTDDHMAKIKDRLIFENKKIEAVAQRKANKEQKLRAKESQANRLAEKAKRKREHFQQVEEWASSAAKHRGGALRDGMDDQFLNGRNNKGPNKKRQAADRKFGFGGKKGRFKQNDRQSLNDMSGFNPRGNFAEGRKKTSKSKSGSGAARPGKRARDAKRARR